MAADLRYIEADYNVKTPADQDLLWFDGTLGKWIAKTLISIVNLFRPVGEIIVSASDNTPTGYIPCDGSAVSRTTYATLFAEIGTAFGAGDGSTTFNIPDLRQRFPLGRAASGTGNTTGGTGGAIDHTHSVPAHYHSMGTGATLNIIASGSHTHGLTDPGHTHAIQSRPDDATASGSFYPTSEQTTQAVQATATDSATTGISVNDNSHTHAASHFDGTIGLVTGGVDGNAAMTSGTNNPPYQVVRFYIWSGTFTVYSASGSAGELMGILGLTKA